MEASTGGTDVGRTQHEAARVGRYHDLDAVRALALMLGVVLHGVMSFMEPRIWIVADTVTDTGANVAFYVIHMFRMTTFFVLAGFFARLLMQKRPLTGFIGNRLKRVGIPLVAFWPITTCAIVAIMIIANMPPPGTIAPAPPPPPAFTAQTFPLTHLWFLYVLLLLYTGTVAIKLLTDILHVGGFLGRVLDRLMGLLTKSDLVTALLTIPVAAAFYLNKGWMMWFGIQTPDTGLFPNVMAIAGFVTAYGFGWWLHRRADLLDHLASRFWVYGITAVAGTWWCLTTAGKVPSFAPVAGHDHPLYCLIYPLSAWSWAFCLIGAGRTLIKKEIPMIRYVSDASYWIYIVHLPLVMLFQYLVKDLNWEVEYKAAVVIFGALALGLLTYQIMVRYTFIGTILNGRRRKIKAAPQPQEVIA
jgi:glucans biosynthesis protein C